MCNSFFGTSSVRTCQWSSTLKLAAPAISNSLRPQSLAICRDGWAITPILFLISRLSFANRGDCLV